MTLKYSDAVYALTFASSGSSPAAFLFDAKLFPDMGFFSELLGILVPLRFSIERPKTAIERQH